MKEQVKKSSKKSSRQAVKVDNVVEESDALSEIEGIDTLTEEEKAKLYEEMDQIFAQSENKIKDPMRFDVSGAPTGKALPIFFNVALVAIVGATIVVSSLIINARDERLIQSNSNELAGESSAIAQEIIEQNQGKLDTQTDELEKIQAQLDEILSGKSNLQDAYNQKVGTFEADLESDLNTQQARLRRELEAQNVSEAEIQKRLRKQEQELRAEYNTQLEAYKKEQEAEQARQEAAMATQIEALQEQENAKRSEIDNLQAEIAQREAELARRTEEINSELDTAQDSLSRLQQEKEKKDTAFKEFDLYHQNVVSLINGKEYQKAKTAIIRAKAFINASAYSTELEARTYIEAFDAYTRMINETVAAIQTAETAGNAEPVIDPAIVQEYEQKVTDLESEKKALESRIEQLTASASTGSQNAQAEINRINTQYTKLQGDWRDLQGDWRDLQGKYEASLAEIEANAIDETGVSNQAIEDMLGNVKLISTYLSLKKNGVDDANMRNFIIELKDEFDVYGEIVDSMALAIDSSGRLKF